MNYIWFSHYGSFQKLQKAVKKSANEPWSDDDKLTFSSVYTRFMAEYKSNGGQKLSITPGDAHSWHLSGCMAMRLCRRRRTSNLKRMIKKSWEEFKLLEEDEEIDLKMNPTNDKKPILSRLLSLVLHASRSALYMRGQRQILHGLTAMSWGGFIWSRHFRKRSVRYTMRIQQKKILMRY